MHVICIFVFVSNLYLCFLYGYCFTHCCMIKGVCVCVFTGMPTKGCYANWERVAKLRLSAWMLNDHDILVFDIVE